MVCTLKVSAFIELVPSQHWNKFEPYLNKTKNISRFKLFSKKNTYILSTSLSQWAEFGTYTLLWGKVTYQCCLHIIIIQVGDFADPQADLGCCICASVEECASKIKLVCLWKLAFLAIPWRHCLYCFAPIIYLFLCIGSVMEEVKFEPYLEAPC